MRTVEVEDLWRDLLLFLFSKADLDLDLGRTVFSDVMIKVSLFPSCSSQKYFLYEKQKFVTTDITQFERKPRDKTSQ